MGNSLSDKASKQQLVQQKTSMRTCVCDANAHKLCIYCGAANQCEPGSSWPTVWQRLRRAAAAGARQNCTSNPSPMERGAARMTTQFAICGRLSCCTNAAAMSGPRPRFAACLWAQKGGGSGKVKG